MESLTIQYKTKESDFLKNKPKVYVSFCPEDERYFKKAANDILQLKDCVVFYYPPHMELQNPEQIFLDLENMSLFVLIVTANFLFRPSSTIERDFRYAREHNISILPILFESGLENEFNQKYGELHCLNAIDDNPTAIPFEIKLKKYLDRLFPEELQIENIRKAFDASIFLSYRKKDRKYAQELMKIIHENKDFQNVSIWYDEFLVPGENFNHGIKSEIDRSDLFVLVVTPNIVNEGNYIMTTEYPIALEMNKTVIPAEMVATERSQLEEKYHNLPAAVSAIDHEKLRTVLQEAVAELGIVYHENDPYRDYLMGLAYLYGIHVEANNHIGAELIRSAADEGIKDAVAKLVFMYTNGEGVERDYEKAITYQNRLLEGHISEFQNTPDQGTACTVFGAMFDLADIHKLSHNLTEAYRVYFDINKFAKDPYIENEVFAKRFSAQAYEAAGQIRMETGEYSEARWECFENAAKIYEDIAAKYPTPLSLLELAECCESLGDVCAERNQIAMYRTYYLKSQKILADFEGRFSVQADIRQDTIRKRLCSCYNRLSHMNIATGYYHAAIDNSDSAIGIAEALAAEFDTADTKRLLMLTYRNAGDNYCASDLHHDDDMAEKMYQKAIQLAEQLFLKDETIASKTDLGTLYEKSGNLQSDPVLLKKALNIFREIEKETKTFRSRVNLYRSYASCGRVYYSYGDLPKAKKHFMESERLCKDVLCSSQEIPIMLDLVGLLENLGEICKKSNDYKGANAYYRQANEILSKYATAMGLLSIWKKYIHSFDPVMATEKALGHFSEARKLQADKQAVLDTLNQRLIKAGCSPL